MVAFVPTALVGSPVCTNWPELFEFGRRQFVITRVYAPHVWLFGLLSSLFSVAGFWGMTVAGVYLFFFAGRPGYLPVAVPLFVAANQVFRAILRQSMAAMVLKQDRRRLRVAALADILGIWATSFLLLGIIASSAAGRTVRWRGIRYKLISPTNIVVLEKRD
jgi:hypothetical protein